MHSDVSDWRSDEDLLRKQLSVLAAAIQVEMYGHDFYLQLADSIRDKEGKLILRSLAEDESRHCSWLASQIDRISPGMDPDSITPDPRYASLTPSKPFLEGVKKNSLPAEDEIRGVELGIQIERGSVRMYNDAAGLTNDPEIKTVLRRLADWEQGHQTLLEENLHYLKRGGSWYGYTPILDG